MLMEQVCRDVLLDLAVVRAAADAALSTRTRRNLEQWFVEWSFYTAAPAISNALPLSSFTLHQS